MGRCSTTLGGGGGIRAYESFLAAIIAGPSLALLLAALVVPVREPLPRAYWTVILLQVVVFVGLGALWLHQGSRLLAWAITGLAAAALVVAWRGRRRG